MKNRLFLLLLLLTASAPLYAGTATLSCTAPTQNTDGSAISGPLTFNWYRGTSASGLIKIGSSPACSYTDNAAPSGTNYWAVTAVSSTGVESAKSAVVSKAVPDPTPNPPTGLTVSNVTAYKMRQTIDGYSFVAIGTVPLGTQCKGQSIDGLSIVPRDAVVMASKLDTKPLIAFAACS